MCGFGRAPWPEDKVWWSCDCGLYAGSVEEANRLKCRKTGESITVEAP